MIFLFENSGYTELTAEVYGSIANSMEHKDHTGFFEGFLFKVLFKADKDGQEGTFAIGRKRKKIIPL